MMEKGWKPNVEIISPNCPRCGSCNTKFCYYNNYTSTQPRYFCKDCRRYWTKGGSLRNVPIGGGCRKSRRGNSKTLRKPIEGIPSNYPTRVSFSICDSPNIDLAEVYASFLNQKPDSRGGGLENKPDQVEPNIFYLSPEYSSLSNPDFGQRSTLPEELAIDLTDCLHFHEQFNDSHIQMYFCGGFNAVQKLQQYSSNQKINNFDQFFASLPGEDATSSHDLLLSDSNMLVGDALQLQGTQMPHFALDQTHDPDVLLSNWSLLDLPTDASFPKP